MVKDKIDQLMNLAKGSIFFPFTEPDVKNPVTSKKVSGRNIDYNKLIKKF